MFGMKNYLNANFYVEAHCYLRTVLLKLKLSETGEEGKYTVDVHFHGF